MAMKSKSVVLLITIILSWMNFSGFSQQSQVTKLQTRLGEQLFRDARFSAPQGDLPASCSTCHLLDEDPQGLRPYADFFNRSWISYRSASPQRFELRNSPGLFDVAAQPRLHYDGEFASLEDLVIGTFAGRPMGWLPSEKNEALAQLQKVVLQDSNYRTLFRSAYDVEVEKLERDAIVRLVARAVADFMRTLRSKLNSPYDQFVQLNGLPAKVNAGESPTQFAERLLARLRDLEASNTLKSPSGFTPQAVRGLKLFYSSGNCVTCHAPPYFTDYSYHNLGISQVEYDLVFGEGAFAAMSIPDSSLAQRPNDRYRQFPVKDKPGEVDLGHWNFIDLKSSTLRCANESDNQLLVRMVGAMKTPGLRHLAYTYPYMHNGAYATVESSLRELQRLSDMAREGKVRSADAELLKIQLHDADIAPLAAFLQTLNEDLKRNIQQANK